MKNVLIFLAGLATGAVGTLIYMRKCVVPAIRDEVARENSEREWADYDYSEYQGLSDEEIEALNKPDEEDKKLEPIDPKTTIFKVGKPKDYTVYSKEETLSEKKEAEVIITKPASDKKKVELVEDDGGWDPYVIDASEFEVDPRYTSRSFYYHTDGVVLDEDTGDRLNEDPKLVFGDTAMRELEENGIVYIRDDAKLQEYVVEMVNAPYGTNIFDEQEE